MSIAQLLSNAGARGLAHELQGYGRGNDTILAHITPREAALLKRRGGSGTVNPMTGLLEFDDGAWGDSGDGSSGAGDWGGSGGPGGGGGGGGGGNWSGNDGGASLDGMGNYNMGGPGRSWSDDGMESAGMGPGNYGGRQSSDWNYGPQAGSTMANFLSNPLSFALDKITRDPLASLANLAIGTVPFVGPINTIADLLFDVSAGKMASNALGNPGAMMAMGANSVPSGSTMRGVAAPGDLSAPDFYNDPASGVYASDPLFAALSQDPVANAPAPASSTYNFVRYAG